MVALHSHLSVWTAANLFDCLTALWWAIAPDLVLTLASRDFKCPSNAQEAVFFSERLSETPIRATEVRNCKMYCVPVYFYSVITLSLATGLAVVDKG
jgi:hypothetical protein